jgi:hypothetical protein
MYTCIIISSLYITFMLSLCKNSKESDFCWVRTPSSLNDFEECILKLKQNKLNKKLNNEDEDDEEDSKEYKNVEPIEDPITPVKPSFLNRLYHSIFGINKTISDNNDNTNNNNTNDNNTNDNNTNDNNTNDNNNEDGNKDGNNDNEDSNEDCENNMDIDYESMLGENAIKYSIELEEEYNILQIKN